MDLEITYYLLLLFFPLSLIIIFNYTTKYSNVNPYLPPSPPKLPIIGNLHQVGTVPYLTFQSLAEIYGPLMLLHFGSVPIVIVSSLELAQEFLRNHDVNFSDRPQSLATDILFRQSCDVAFCKYGEYWRQAKKICVLELLSQKRVQEFRFAREEEISDMVNKIHQSCATGGSINVSELLISVTYNIISRAAFGRVHGRGDGASKLIKLIRKAQDFLGAFCFKDFFPYLGWVDEISGLTGNIREISNELHDFLDQVVEKHQGLKRGDDDGNSDRKDLVDILLDLQKHNTLGFQLSRDNIIAILMDIFLGGTDNNATTLDWAMAELMKHPKIMEKAQEEVRRVVGSKSSIDEADIDKMDYLKCVLKETFRVHGPGIAIPRKSLEDIKLENGYEIPARTTILINTWAIHRDPKVWNRPEDFVPERFVGSSVDLKFLSSPILSFGSGRRGCPGVAFAIVEAQLIMANMLCWFDWRMCGDARAEDLDMSARAEALDMSAKYKGLMVRKKVPLVLVPSLRFR